MRVKMIALVMALAMFGGIFCGCVLLEKDDLLIPTESKREEMTAETQIGIEATIKATEGEIAPETEAMQQIEATEEVIIPADDVTVPQTAESVVQETVTPDEHTEETRGYVTSDDEL